MPHQSRTLPLARAIIGGLAAAFWPIGSSAEDISCHVEIIVLSAGQDAGAPQIGNVSDPAWKDPRSRLLPSSIAVVDHVTGDRYLFDATPSITEQLQLLDELVPPRKGPLGLSGVFLTHAHMGHYGGLLYVGLEAANTDEVSIYAMPRMAGFLEDNGPWSQLLDLGNIKIEPLTANQWQPLNETIFVSALPVPHRDEFSETVGFAISTGQDRVLYLPDIDSWEEWAVTHGQRLSHWAQLSEAIFIDSTFFDDNELPGRDMSKIPHPRVSATMDLIEAEAPDFRDRVHFIHYNHTNPIRFTDSRQTKEVQDRGFNIARRGDRHCLKPLTPSP